MDFFESQDSARRNTGRLILLFGLAVISLILITNFLVMLIFGFLSTEMTSVGALTPWQFNWQVFAMVGALVAAVIILGSLYKIVSLSGGGARVAEMMNGRLLVAGTGDLLRAAPDECRRRDGNCVRNASAARLRVGRGGYQCFCSGLLA
jgi:energy-coupling factor transporter transmembrane protein EcfT